MDFIKQNKKTLIVVGIILIFVGCQSEIYRDENGIIKCPEDVEIGYIGKIDGVSYIVVW